MKKLEDTNREQNKQLIKKSMLPALLW